jgi:glutathione synthase/RimK-type ligase-like ATP-grasp enzyme
VILIITNKEDVHPTPVIEYLNERHVAVFRLNTESLLSDYAFCWESDRLGCDFWIKNIRNGLECRGSDVTALWERRPEAPKELYVQNLPEINAHNLKEALGFLQFLRYYLKNIPSIGGIANDRPASSKMLQLKVAQDVGFHTPDTCFSNRKEDIVRFARPYEQVILKSIENDNLWLEEEYEYVFYSQKVQSAGLAEQPDAAFSQTVSYVQNYIEKAFELRVTVVGREIFACAIDSQQQDDDTGKVDWRQGYDHGLKYARYDLPAGIAEKCRSFLQRMGLNFGCFDLVVTPGGRYVFLECNPNGQWLWIEQETGLPISEAIAAFLMKPACYRRSMSS